MSLRYTVRSLRKNPAFPITAVLTLALGIGASAAIFSVVNAVLLRPLPYGNPGRLTIITSDMVARDVKDFPIASGAVEHMREGGTLFSGLAALNTFRLPMRDPQGNTAMIRGANVSTNLLPVLGEHVVAGRDFTDADGTPPQITLGPDGRPVPPTTPPPPMKVMLGYGYWQRRFGGDRSVVGRIVSFGPVRAEVIGIAPPEMQLLFPPNFHVERHPDIYLPARVDWAHGSLINVAWRIVARMRPGVSVAAAQSQMNRVEAVLGRLAPIIQTAGARLRVVLWCRIGPKSAPTSRLRSRQIAQSVSRLPIWCRIPGAPGELSLVTRSLFSGLPQSISRPAASPRPAT
jgi:putative ABC transport system permease protein